MAQLRTYIGLILVGLPLYTFAAPSAEFPDGELPETSGPGPVFSFGHNIQKKDQCVLKNKIAYYNRDFPDTSLWVSSYGALYGFTDSFTLLVNVPVIIKDEEVPGFRSRGLGSSSIQGEYAFYDHKEAGVRNQMTVVGALMIPSGAVDIMTIFAQPNWGYFFGFTTSNFAHVWYTYSAFGTYIPKKKKPLALGQHIFASLGAGRSLFQTPTLYFALLADLSIIYARPDLVMGHHNFTTGGTFIGLGPTFRFSYKDFVCLGGIQYPIGQTRGSLEPTLRYRTTLTLSWVF